MWISATHAVRVIAAGEYQRKKPVAEIFRWSESEGGWIHVVDASAEEVPKYVDMTTMTEVSESFKL